MLVRSLVIVSLLLCATQIGARGADGEFDERRSSHFLLRQDVAIDRFGGIHGSRQFEIQVLDELERAYDAVDQFLGLRPDRIVEVVVYDPQVFDTQFAGLFRFPAAGFYGGVIRIRGATRLTHDLARVLHHELVHAAFDLAAPSLLLPAWVNEGSAEWFEARAAAGKRGLSGRESAALASLAQEGSLYSLDGLSGATLARLGPRGAGIAYLQSYALIDYLVRQGGERNFSRFLAELLRSKNLDRSLRRIYRFDARGLEARFRKELG